MKRWLVVFTLILLSLPATAEKPWFYPRASSKAYANPYLTPRRALQGEWSHRFEGQLVLWHGVAANVHRDEPQSLQLETDSGSVPVRFSRKVKNLQADRQGATIAIKGFVRRTDDGRVYLEGRSAIPWRPAGGFESGVSLLQQWVDFQRPELAAVTRQKIASAIEREARSNGVDPLFLTALIQVESGFDPEAVSVSGARGLGQLMPTTAQGLGVDPRDIDGNIQGCARMVAGLLRRYEHRSDGKALVLASYNAGPNLVARIQGVPNYEQTVNYVFFIGSLYQDLKKQEQLLK
ncbi:MAG: lytic transglycosylase domain-containing protein [Candidatus Eremiobacteraeota bacterium]|nr:lytic transglycosylase domain-containing protein [Candidatus Eremiobacteraeota bacterium]